MPTIIKPTLLAVILLEIMSVFFLLYIYNKFVSNPQNFASTAVVNKQAKNNGVQTDLQKLINTPAPSKNPSNKK
jgi:hypothetical protein